VSIGDALAAARREAGLTITQVSQRTCIRETIVRGIERGDYSACGGDFYARGHIRSIARAVELDPEELVREYDATQATPRPMTAADVFQPYTPVRLKESRRPNWSLVLLAGVLAILGIAGFQFYRHHGSPGPSRPAASTQHEHHKQKAKTTPVAHTAPRHVRLVLVVTRGNVTWTQVTTSAGRVIFRHDVNGPARMVWTRKGTITLQLGNPGGVSVYLNGKKQVLKSINPVTLTCTRAICSGGG
jgi:cytoskeletal protein RodZ